MWLIYTLLGAALFFLAAMLGAGYYTFHLALVRREKRMKIQEFTDEEHARQEQICKEKRAAGTAWLLAQNPEDVTMQSRDGLTLKGWYLPAAKPSNNMVVFAHGYNCNGLDEFGPFFRHYHEDLNYHMLIPDHRAHGRSEGKYIGFAGIEWRDLLDWTEVFVRRLGPDTGVVLHGISMGAATVMNCNVHNPPDYVKCVVEDCGFSNGQEMMWLAACRDLKLNIPPLLWGTMFWYRVCNGIWLKKASDPIGNIEKFARPTLFVHGAADPFVPAEMSLRCYEAAAVPKELFLAEGAFHVMSYYLYKEEYEARLDAWLGKWMKETVYAE